MTALLWARYLLMKHYPLDTRRKLNFHKTFSRLPGRLLNVLCTFNLRPVFTVKEPHLPLHEMKREILKVLK